MKLFKIILAVFIGAILVTTGAGSGSSNNASSHDYRCNSALQIADSAETAAIYGTINDASFLETSKAIVAVLVYKPDTAGYEKIIELAVPQTLTGRDAEFSICWLAPGDRYRIIISDIDIPYTVGRLSLQAGQVFGLNGGHPI